MRDEHPAPAPGDRELLVRVHASSVNAVDRAIAAGMLNGMRLAPGPASSTTPGKVPAEGDWELVLKAADALEAFSSSHTQGKLGIEIG